MPDKMMNIPPKIPAAPAPTHSCATANVTASASAPAPLATHAAQRGRSNRPAVITDATIAPGMSTPCTAEASTAGSSAARAAAYVTSAYTNASGTTCRNATSHRCTRTAHTTANPAYPQNVSPDMSIAVAPTANTALTDLALRGPWALLHSVQDMQLLIQAFADELGALPPPHPLACDVVGRKAATPDAPPARTKTLLDTMRHRPPPPPHEEPVPTLLGAAGASACLFELRWHTLMIMYASSALRAQLARGAPKQVGERMLAPFQPYFEAFLFGGKHRAILTPLEIVPRVVSDFRLAYFHPGGGGRDG